MTLHLLESIIPRDRDFEPTGKAVDQKFSASFIDLGTLQGRACSLAAPYYLQIPFPEAYLQSLIRMVHIHVRHVLEVVPDPEHERVYVTTQDKWGEYTYIFSMKRSWFEKRRASGHE